MGSFLLSLFIFIIFSGLGTILSIKLPKLDIEIPEPIYMFVGWGAMCGIFFIPDNRLLQIFVSLLCGLLIGYLSNLKK